MPPPPQPRPRLTHFVSIPLHTAAGNPTLTTALSSLAAHLAPILPPSAIRPPTTLHLTLGVMSLPTAAHLQSALDFLQSLDLHALLRGAPTAHNSSSNNNSSSSSTDVPPPVDTPPPPPPLTLSLRGLATMGSPRRASVLYAVPIDETGRLQGFAEAVRARLLDAGYVLPDERALRLHATVVNTVYVGGRGRGARRITFDAGTALEWGRGVVWVEDVPVEGVCICRMGEVEVEGVGVGYLEVGRRGWGEV